MLSRKETRAEVKARQAEARAAKQAEDAAAAAAKQAAEEKRIRDEAVRRTEQRYEATRLIQRVRHVHAWSPSPLVFVCVSRGTSV